MRNLLIAIGVLLLSSCVNEYQLQTTTTTYLYSRYNTLVSQTQSKRLWIYEGTKSDAEDQCGCKEIYSIEPPYTVLTNICTNFIGKAK